MKEYLPLHERGKSGDGVNQQRQGKIFQFCQEAGLFNEEIKEVLNRETLQQLLLKVSSQELSTDQREIVDYIMEWDRRFEAQYALYQSLAEEKQIANYKHLGKGIVLGYLVGMVLAVIADSAGLERESFVEGAIRFIVGASDTIGGYISIMRHKMLMQISGEKVSTEDSKPQNNRAEIFATGALVGAAAGPLSQGLIQYLHYDTSGIAGGIYAFCYSNGDNIGGGAYTLVQEIREKGMMEGMKHFFSDPFQLINFLIITGVVTVDMILRASGNMPPQSQIVAATEGILLNIDSVVSVIAVLLYDKHIQQKLFAALYKELNQEQQKRITKGKASGIAGREEGSG